jgi:2-hydroxychromene-2-carboxylate isomerase
MKTFDFYFDIGSPAAYLAWTQMPKLEKETNAQANYVPFLLGGVFKATGNQSPVMIPAKGKWLRADLAQWAQQYGIAPVKMPPQFPVNTLNFMRALCAVQQHEPERFQALGTALYEGMFKHGLAMNEPEVVGQVLAQAGFNPTKLMEMSQAPEVKAALAANTEAAIAAGAFGAPSFVVNGHLFWGQDRMEFVRRALLA